MNRKEGNNRMLFYFKQYTVWGAGSWDVEVDSDAAVGLFGALHIQWLQLHPSASNCKHVSSTPNRDKKLIASSQDLPSIWEHGKQPVEISLSQLRPVHPVAQLQEYFDTPESVHFPLLLQGWVEQSSLSPLHAVACHPVLQVWSHHAKETLEQASADFLESKIYNGIVENTCSCTHNYFDRSLDMLAHLDMVHQIRAVNKPNNHRYHQYSWCRSIPTDKHKYSFVCLHMQREYCNL